MRDEEQFSLTQSLGFGTDYIIKPDSKFRIVIPEEIRRALNISKGDYIVLKQIKLNSSLFFIIKKASRPKARKYSKNIMEVVK